MIGWQGTDRIKVESEVEVVKKVVRLTVNLTVNEGQIEEFNHIAEAMTEVTKAEPGTLGYEWFAHGDGKRFTLLETYEDTSAIEAHFMGAAVQQWVPKLAATCSVDGFAIYGDPGPRVAETSAGFGAVIMPYWMGIDR